MEWQREVRCCGVEWKGVAVWSGSVKTLEVGCCAVVFGELCVVALSGCVKTLVRGIVMWGASI